jgi:cytochrome c peroxidase
MAIRGRGRQARALGALGAGLAVLVLGAACSDRLFNVNPRIDDIAIDAPEPGANPTTPAKVELGRLLFWDPILSGEKDVACATCHHPAHGYSDGRDLALGVGATGFGAARRDQSDGRIPIVPRNSMTLLNVAYNGLTESAPDRADPEAAPMLWDSRLRSLEAQALDPIRTRNEMRGDAYSEKAALDSVVARLDAIPAYVERFTEVFGGAKPVSAENMAKAIAAFQRTLVARESRFDHYVQGDEEALSALEKRGMFLFTRVGCYRCHSGPMMSDFELHVLGVDENPALGAPDQGSARFAFRTPTLRNLGFTAPYMHNGTKATLEDVVRFYGVPHSENPHVATDSLDADFPPIFPIEDDQVEAIAAFLRTFDDPDFDRTIPVAVPSGLPVGGNIQ